MKIEVGCVVMLTKPMYMENIRRVGIVEIALPIVAHKEVEDTWLVRYGSPVMTTDGPNVFSCTEGWRMIVLAPPGNSLQDFLEAPQPVLEVA